ncbi:hypothetical protein DEO72_LG10g1453 [Vigna unguiculata]|uniref:Uncharacterized protein n=1 Tax=Vigna unguiculata TaxID=3917 RepID=A0A4D6NDK9_VIGUN|nr:hypothetical protein DEO72_LG10g1453 [Vigna unguiculata]
MDCGVPLFGVEALRLAHSRPDDLAQARLAETNPDSCSSSRSGGELSFERHTISPKRERLASARTRGGLRYIVVGVAQARKPFFRARDMLAQAGSDSLKLEFASLAGALMVCLACYALPWLEGEQLGGELRYPPQVQASAESDQILEGEQLGGELRYPPQVQASAESDQILEGEQLGGELRYPPQVQASAESDQIKPPGGSFPTARRHIRFAVLFLFWYDPPGGYEFLPGDATLFAFYFRDFVNKEGGRCSRYEQAWFVQVLMLRLAASKTPPGDSVVLEEIWMDMIMHEKVWGKYSKSNGSRVLVMTV